MKNKHISYAIKRTIDISAALLAFVLLFPVILLTIILVRWQFGSPIVYVALRVGKDSRVFRLYKFRSMTNETDDSGELLPDEQRITRFGALLRKSSIDELPGLWNVLKGEMSLVGPRPFSSLYLHRYTEEQNRRHSVLPGITGWAQVNGRNSLSWEDKFRNDLWYIDNWSILLDLKILVKTVLLVFGRKDTSYEGYVSAPEFMGTLQKEPLKDSAENVANSAEGLPSQLSNRT